MVSNGSGGQSSMWLTHSLIIFCQWIFAFVLFSFLYLVNKKKTFYRFSLALLQGAVSGVLLVTPNNIMFDPHRMDPLVQAHGCEEYGIMCPVEEVQSAAVCKEITDPKIREAVPE